MAYSDVILADSPVGYWKLDETSGTTANDSSGNANHGTISGSPTLGANGLVFEPSGKCIDFDGVDDDIAASLNFSSNAPFSISFFCNVSSTQVDAGANIGLVDIGTYTSTTGFGVWLDKASGNTLRCRLNQNYQNCDITIVADAVNYVVVTYDGTTLKGYVDTVLNNTLVASYTTSTLGCSIGSRSDTANEFFTGKLQHVAIFNAALTPLQIRKHYQAGIAQGFHKEVLALNPTAYFPLNEASGDAIDWSGNDNNGTLSGGVTQGSAGALAYDDSTAYTFDGVDSYVPFLTPAGVLANDDKTIGIWFTTPATLGSEPLLATRVNHGGVDNELKGYAMDVQSDGSIRYFHNASGTAQTAAGVLVANTIYFIAVSTGINAATIVLYVDGVVVSWNSNTVTTAPTELASGYTALGRQGIAYGEGIIQSAFLIDSILTAAQIRTLYQSGKTLIESRGYPKVIQNLAPSGYWRLGEASGTTAFDESGNGNDGVINGSPVMATSDGALHQSKLKAISADGTNDYISIPDDAALKFGSSDFTVGGWFKIPSGLSIGSEIGLIIKGSGGAGGKRYLLKVITGGIPQFDIDDNTTLKSATSSTDLRDDLWHLLIGVRDGNNLRLYIDTTEQTSADITGYGNLDDTNPLTILAGYSSGVVNYSTCDAGEVFLDNAALTPQQIKQIYEAGRSRYAAEVISYEPTGYWRGNETSGTALIDYGAEGNDGTLVNATFGNAETPLSNETATSIDFDGSGDYVTIPHIAAYNQDEQTWLFNSFAPAVQPSDSKGLIYKGSSTGASAREVTSEYRSVGSEGLSIGMSTTSVEIVSLADDSVFGTGWGFAGITKALNGANDDIFGYFNGVLVGSLTTSGHCVQNSVNLEFGRLSTASTAGRYYDGQMAEVSVFPTALTGEQILDIYEMASFSVAPQVTTYKVNGSLTESLSITEWIARVHEWDTGAYLTQVLIDTSASPLYSAEVDPFSGPVSITITPNMGTVWSESKVVVVGEYIYPTDPETNNRYYKVTTGGTTGNTEPTWPTSGTVNDNGVVFTFESSFVRPVTHGPVVPQLLP